MPLGKAIGGEPVVGAVVAKVVEPALLHTGCFASALFWADRLVAVVLANNARDCS